MGEFRALVLETRDGELTPSLRLLTDEDLPAGEVLVRIAYSSLNYKDGLALTGRNKVVRSYPMVPGVDFAGTVETSEDPRYHPGQEVILTGWGVGERHWGGFSQKARVSAEWLVPLPPGLSAKQAMGIGSAGFTSMLSVMALEEHGLDSEREILVTGAAGGVGSLAVALLASRGYHVTASTGRAETHDFLRRLGAQTILGREDLTTPSDKPLASERWGGAVDPVGGETLASLLRSMAYGTSVAASGLAGGKTLDMTVFPFILRGVSLIGIDSVKCPFDRRQTAWNRLAAELPLALLEEAMEVVSLEDVPALGPQILAGQVRGRVVVDVNA